MKFYRIITMVILLPVFMNADMHNYKRERELKISNKNYCILKQNENQMIAFNFTELSAINDYIIKDDENERSVYVRLCHKLESPCNKRDDYSICIKKKDREIGIGKYPPQTQLNSSGILFTYVGDKCNQHSNYTTTILMSCDYNATIHNSLPKIFPHGEDQCSIYFHWSTNYACGRQHTSNCSVTDKSGHQYDFSSLTKTSENYEIPVEESLSIVLNVCHSVIFGADALCQEKSASCLRNSAANKVSYLNLGEVTNSAIVEEDGILKMKYGSGDLCPLGLTSELHMKTVIIFICDHNVQDSLPKYVNGSTTCVYYLEWKTKLACKESSPNLTLTTVSQYSPVASFTAVMMKPVTKPSHVKCATKNNEISLVPLIKLNDNYILKSNGSEFHINVCNPLVSTGSSVACRDSAACLIYKNSNGEVTKEISLGNPSVNLIIDEKRNAILHYKEGAVCPENPKDTISSNVTFICNHNANSGVPYLIKYEDCTYVFKWETEYVCSSAIENFNENCTISNSHAQIIDLSLLRKQTFYVKNGKNKTYRISICEINNNCSHTICEGVNNGYGSLSNVKLDYPKDSVKLQYSKGTKCLNSTYESEIMFLCNSTVGVGTPVVTWESECEVHFTWPTSVICTSQMISPATSSGAMGEEKEIESNHGPLIIFSVTGISIIVFIVILLRNPSRRARCHRIFSNLCSSSSNDRVKYCRVNTTEEARLLLDNCDPTAVYQSDSDDDLLGV